MVGLLGGRDDQMETTRRHRIRVYTLADRPQTDSDADRCRHTQTDRQTDRHTHTHTHTHTSTHTHTRTTNLLLPR